MLRRTTILLIVAAVILLGISALVYVTEDRTAPRISFREEVTSWSESDGETVLLMDADAIDSHDGNVSDSLRIHSIIPSQDGSTVTVVYVAKDSRNNVATRSRVLEYTGER